MIFLRLKSKVLVWALRLCAYPTNNFLLRQIEQIMQISLP